MALLSKNYLDLTGLQAYDSLLKNQANNENQIAYKTVLKSSDGNSLLFFKKPNAIEGTDTPDKTISLGNQDMQEQLDALADIVGATWDSTNEEYTIDLDATFAATEIVDALNELKGQINILNGADTVSGSVAKSIKDAVESLDTSADIGIASVNNNVVTIKGSIAESDGIITDGSAPSITLEEVAFTGAAEDVSTQAIDDGAVEPTVIYQAGTVQGILEAIARDLNELETTSQVTVEKQGTAETGYIATYVVKQNNIQVGEKINIPKDYLVKSATVQTVDTPDVPYSGARVGDKYIDFVINTRDTSENEEHLYLPVNDLMAAISGGTNAETTVSISNTNEITVTINTIQAAKINYINSTSGSDVNETVQAALSRIDGSDSTPGSIKKAVKDAVTALDADLDAATDSSVTDQFKVPVMTGITEVDGVVTAVDSIDADRAGAATEAYEAIGSIPTTSINALFA